MQHKEGPNQGFNSSVSFQKTLAIWKTLSPTCVSFSPFLPRDDHTTDRKIQMLKLSHAGKFASTVTDRLYSPTQTLTTIALTWILPLHQPFNNTSCVQNCTGSVNVTYLTCFQNSQYNSRASWSMMSCTYKGNFQIAVKRLESQQRQASMRSLMSDLSYPCAVPDKYSF